LLREGAQLATGVDDVLDLLYDAERGAALNERARGDSFAGLDPILREVLQRVGAGEDTPGRLLGARGNSGLALRALGELELMGLVVRGDGGRYVVRDPLASHRLR
jgi:DNA processing protein